MLRNWPNGIRKRARIELRTRIHFELENSPGGSRKRARFELGIRAHFELGNVNTRGSSFTRVLRNPAKTPSEDPFSELKMSSESELKTGSFSGATGRAFELK